MKLEHDDIELPGDGHSDTDLFEELGSLYRMENVIDELRKLKSQFDLADEEGEDRPKLGHFIFTGAPGTGKFWLRQQIFLQKTAMSHPCSVKMILTIPTCTRQNNRCEEFRQYSQPMWTHCSPGSP